MDFSIVIATFDRCASLERLLGGIAQHFGKSEISHEIIVANNARQVEKINRIDEIVGALQREQGSRFHLVREPEAGKCRAQNRAIAQARGNVLVFFDDDVEVRPAWLQVTAEFFRTTSFDAMQGSILMPPAMAKDDAFLRAHNRYRTINFVQYPPTMREIKTLTGANMAIRREVFDRIGLFNENLGPGRSGISEDVEFARRLVDSGGKIGYEHRAGVYHEVDWTRLTDEFFRQRHEQQGRSRLIFKHQSLVSITPNVLRSVVTFAWYSLTGNERKKYRAKGRYFHYRAMLQEKIRNSAGSQV
ncbi:MAG TPA: glycosyltransferase [Candidatus Binatus sp.]|nr:glycosyltransferase [Candidatus Binatus sp.]